MNLFSIDALFAQMFPWLEGISWDLGTILTAMVFLGFLLLAFDWVQTMLLGKVQTHYASRNHKYFMDEATKHEQMSIGLASGSMEREYHDRMMNSYLSDAVKAKRHKR